MPQTLRMSPQYQLKGEQRLVQKLKLIGRIKLGQFLSLPENDFKKYINKVERDPLFQKLRYQYHLISCRKFPQILSESPSLEFKEALVPQPEDIEVGEIIEKDPQLLTILKKIGDVVGIEKFRKFLYGKEVNIKEIIRECNLSSGQIKIFKEFINRFQLRSILASSSSLSSFDFSPRSRTHKIASLEKKGDKILICPLEKESYLIKGKYLIDYDRFGEMIKRKELVPSRASKISNFFKKLDLINRRTTTIYQVICHLKEIQYQFFQSGHSEQLLPLTQSELARRMKVNPSTISRSIANKSIITPQKEEKPLKFFFYKGRVQNFLYKVFQQEKEERERGILFKPFTDEMIQKRLEKEYQIKLSRRSISKYRQVMQIPSSYQRDKVKAKSFSADNNNRIKETADKHGRAI